MRARIAAGLIALCVAVLLVDYAVASWRAPRDDQRVKALQEQVKSDAAQSPTLTAEQKRITAARRARKFRDNIVAWVLILAAGLFFLPRGDTPGAVPVARARAQGLVVPDRGSDAGVGARPTVCSDAVAEIDLGFVDQLVAAEGHGREAAIRLLQAIQEHYRYLPDAALRRLCELTEITPAQIAGTSSFYAQFRRTPVGKHIVRVCHGTACHVSGARQVTDQLRRDLGIPEGSDTDPQRMFTIEEVACLGCCSLAPVLMVDGQTAGRLTPASASAALEPLADKETA
jgi:NADH:ubiquinone oxidoreductase subunit E